MGETGGPNDSAIFGSVSEDMTFTITLPEAGDYYFTAMGLVTVEREGSSDTESVQVLQGITDILTVTAEGVSDLVITASPLTADEVGVNTGKIKLTIYDESSRISNIRVFEDDEDTASLDSTFSTPFTYNNENPSVGFHTYKFCFDDAVGNTLYTCREAVTVFCGLTTDSWIGSAPYFVQNEDGTARFVITEELLKKYDAEVVPDTAIVVYNSTETGYDYYPIESPSSEINSLHKTSIADSPLNFVFDANGNAYFVWYGEQGSGADLPSGNHWIIVRQPANGSAPCLFHISSNSISSLGDSLKLVADLKNSVLYAYYLNEMTMHLYRFPSVFGYECSDTSTTSSVTLADNEVESFEINFSSPQGFYHSKIAINGGVLYDLGSCTVDSETKSMLVIYNFENADSDSLMSAVADKTVDLSTTLSELGASSATITDMLYQDGAVYMLLREYSFDFSKRSRGAVLRYNTLTGNLDSLGFAGAVDKSSLANAKISAYTYVPDDAYKPLYNEESLTNQWFVNAGKTFTDSNSNEQEILYDVLPGIFTPAITTSISTKQFYGPSKFVAVKPKKLVIADDGIAFYTDNDVLKYKNVNRIVTVDLNSFSIVGTEDVSANFGDESSDEIEVLNVSSSTTYQDALADEVSTSSPKYYENDDGARLTSASGVYLFAPCGD